MTCLCFCTNNGCSGFIKEIQHAILETLKIPNNKEFLFKKVIKIAMSAVYCEI
jgi:hypothetical protein